MVTKPISSLTTIYKHVMHNCVTEFLGDLIYKVAKTLHIIKECMQYASSSNEVKKSYCYFYQDAKQHNITSINLLLLKNKNDGRYTLLNRINASVKDLFFATLNHNNPGAFPHIKNSPFYTGHCGKTYASGFKYIGEVKYGLRHGKGRMTYAGGSTYDGEWKNGKYHGKGRMTFPDGSTYEGEWEADEFHGKGRMTYYNGSTYDGQWRIGDYHGKGIMTYSDGSTYDGEWKNGKWDGQGKMTYDDGSTYEGEWKNGNYPGKGIRTYSSGSTYDGEWKNDKHHGKGIMTYSDGSTYDGQWLFGKRRGYGSMTYSPDNTNCSGYWDNDEPTQIDYNQLSSEDKIFRFLASDMSMHAGGCSLSNLPYLNKFLEEYSRKDRSEILQALKIKPLSQKNEFSFSNSQIWSCSRGGHAFLLESIPLSDGNVTLKLYNSNGFSQNAETKQYTCKTITIKKDKITEALEILDATKNADEFAQAFCNTLEKNGLSVTSAKDDGDLQRVQKIGSCSIDCIMTYLHNNLSPRQYNDFKLYLFREAHSFYYSQKIKSFMPPEGIRPPAVMISILVKKIEQRKAKIKALISNQN